MKQRAGKQLHLFAMSIIKMCIRDLDCQKPEQRMLQKILPCFGLSQVLFKTSDAGACKTGPFRGWFGRLRLQLIFLNVGG